MKTWLKAWFAAALMALLLAATGQAAPKKNTPPRAEITSPRDGATYETGKTVELAGDATDDEDAAGRLFYQWDVDAVHPDLKRQRVMTSHSRNAKFLPKLDQPGSAYDVRLIVTDSGLLRDTVFAHMSLADPARTSAPAPTVAAAAGVAAAPTGAAAGAPPTPTDSTQLPLGPGDVVHVTVYAGGDKQEEFTGEVSPAGNLTSPLIGDVPVAGSTATDVAARMKTIFARDYFVNPQVTVEVKDFARKVFVSGEVKNPGAYSVQEGLTVMGVCTLAGGFSDFAALNRVKLVRTESGRTRTIDIDLSKVRRGKIPDMAVMAGDRIDVPHRRY